MINKFIFVLKWYLCGILFIGLSQFAILSYFGSEIALKTLPILAIFYVIFTCFFKKIFLIKEIKSNSGELHFRRYRIFSTPWFKIFIHRIYKSDEDKHMHTHPWNFVTIILSGNYKECVVQEWYSEHVLSGEQWENRKKFRPYFHKAGFAHKLYLNSPVTTLVFCFGKNKKWGYVTDDGIIDNSDYRRLKHEGYFDTTIK